jgi:4-amino-4-deoxy-L-arabinose transferase-like glycosyltransferase
MKRSLAALALAIGIFFVVGAWDLRLPGLMSDEAADAVPALEMLAGKTPSAMQNTTLFGRDVPVMMLHHIGPATIYTSAAGFALLGPSVESLRLSQLAVGALALVLLWLLARLWGGNLAAAIAALLCASMPPFIWWSRAGANYTVPLLPLALGMMLALSLWWRGRRARWLALAAFLFGAGLTTKILFVWMLIPLGATLLFGARPARALAALRALRAPAIALVIAAGLLGLAPLIAHNLPVPQTLNFILSNALQTQSYGHDNLNFAANFARVLTEFGALMDGHTLAMGLPGPELRLGAAALALAFTYELITLLIRRRAPQPGDTARVFLIACLAGVLPASTVSTSSIGATYVFILVPFAWLLIALALVDAARALARNATRASILIAGLTVALVANHVVANALVLDGVARTGGRGGWSDAIYALDAALANDLRGRPIIAMDWGFNRNLEFLSNLKRKPTELFETRPQPSPKFNDVSSVALRDPANLYLFHTPAHTFFKGHWEVFEREAQKAHKALRLAATFGERDGAPNTLVYTAVDAPPSFAISDTLAGRNARFETGPVLLGGRVSYDASRREVAALLQWQSAAPRLPDDTILVHIVREATGDIIANGDVQPVYGSYRFPAWQPGEVVVDPHWVALPEGLAPGVYQVRVGLYDTQTKQRRAIDDPLKDASGNSLMLARFSVP